MSESSFARLFRILQLIPPYPRRTDTSALVRQLSAEGFNVTPRTVQRDLNKLEAEALGLERIGDSKPFQWRFSAKAKVSGLPGLGQPEALALLTLEKHLSSLVPQATWLALKPQLDAARKLVEGAPARRWLDRVRVVQRSQPQSAPRVDVEVLAAVQAAMIEDRTLRVRYRRAAGDTAKEYALHPRGFVWRDSVAYMLAMNGEFHDVRQYALHRMTHASLGDDKARRAPDGFQLDAHLAAGEIEWRLAADPIRLELVFFGAAGRSVLEAPLAKDQVVKVDGDATTVTATVPDTRVLRSWLLSFGEAVEVKRPRALRDAIAGSVRAAAHRYDP